MWRPRATPCRRGGILGALPPDSALSVQPPRPVSVHPPATPGVRAFATVGAFEAMARGIALSVYPVLMYKAWGDAVTVSGVARLRPRDE